MSGRQNVALLLILFIISPLLSFSFVLLSIKEKRIYSIVFLSLIMMVFAILFPPYADLYRHNLFYFSHQNTDIDSFVVSKGFDFLLPTISANFARIGLNFEIIRGLFVLFSYLISLLIFYNIYKDRYSRTEIISVNQYMYFFLIFFLTVPFFWIVNGLRFAFSAYLFLWGYFKVFIQRKKSGLLFFLIAVCCHFSIVVAVIFVYLCHFAQKIYINKKIAFLVLSTALIFNSLISNVLISNFQIFSSQEFDIIDRNVRVYVENNNIFLDSLSINGLIAHVLNRMMLFPLFIITFKSRSSKLRFDLVLIWLLLFSLMPLYIPFQRYSMILIPLLIINYLYNFCFYSDNKILLRLLFFSSLISFLSYVYGYRDPLLKGNFHKSLLPVVCSIVNYYDIQWLDEHLDFNGEFK